MDRICLDTTTSPSLSFELDLPAEVTLTESLSPNLLDWIKINLRIGTLSFGGSVRWFLFHDELVSQRQWVSEEEFQEALSLVQVVPGPNLINLGAYLGHKLIGKRGAVLGTLALALPGALLGVFILSLLDLNQEHWLTLFRGFSLGSLSLFALFIVKLAPGIRGKVGERELSRLKVNLRWALVGVFSVLSLLQLPFSVLMVIGIVAGLTLEFSLP